MNEKISSLKKAMIAVLIVEAAALAVLGVYFHFDILTAALIVVSEAAFMFYLFEKFQDYSRQQSEGVKSVLGNAAAEAFLTGGVGMIIYDDDYVITWMSELFKSRSIDRVGTKVLTWIPEADDLISGKEDTAYVQLDEKIYEMHRKEDEPMIFFKDVTELTDCREKYHNEHIVIGMASLDNYDDSSAYGDENQEAAVNASVRGPLLEYCAGHGIFTKRLSSSKYILILNEKIFSDLAADHFSILGKVRKGAQKQDMVITLSMSFARGTSDFEQLDQMVTNLMDLAQTRGGDQVAMQTYGEDVKYFGGSTEAAEKRSRVRVRVMSHALRDLIMRSSNVIICCHKTADFDCIGSAICLARMAESLHRPAVIIAKTGGIEEKLNAALQANQDDIKQEVIFVTEGEALNHLGDTSLVIMTDHHNIKQSNGAKVLENANRVVIIDHHRRSTEMGVKPVLVYIEAGASSTCELLTEMIPYVSNTAEISPLAATIMLTGMIVDTQTWRVRTGARTYDAASALKEIGADSAKAYGWLKDSFDDFALKAKVAVNSERYPNGIMIAEVKDRVMSRSMMSQVADTLLGVQGVQGAFVIANDSDSESAISARSDGHINVQVIMENMNGGGHMTAAAVQRSKCSLDDLKKELLNAIDDYNKEDEEDESDS